MFEDQKKAIQVFDFRNLSSALYFGTASDRFAGWVGQIYHAPWAITERKKTVEGMRLIERVLPIASVTEYFQHFKILELDFTFYRPLLEGDGSPSPNLKVLEQYAFHAPQEALFLVKAPQKFIAQRYKTKEGWQINPFYLDLEAYMADFHTPLKSVLGDKVKGILFQQAYQTVKDSPSLPQLLAQFHHFFGQIPRDYPISIELRSPHFLQPTYFRLLQDLGIGFCFSHWTWLPSLKEQWIRSGGSYYSPFNVLRLLCPREMPYADALSHAYPFNQAVPALSETPQARQMIDEAAALAFKAMEQSAELALIMNNRAWGNSPLLAQALSEKIIRVMEKRA